LTLDPGNFLLLDEPTNHLDLPTREALEDALASFGGTLLFVSHDRYFINRVATRVAAFGDGRLITYDGGYDDYVAAVRGGPQRSAAPPGRAMPGKSTPGKATPGKTTSDAPRDRAPIPDAPRPASHARGGSDRRADAEARNRRNRELRVVRDRIAAVEARILPLETRLKELDTAMSSADIYKEPGAARRLGEEKKTIEIDLAHLYDEWDHATSELQVEEARFGRDGKDARPS